MSVLDTDIASFSRVYWGFGPAIEDFSKHGPCIRVTTRRHVLTWFGGTLVDEENDIKVFDLQAVFNKLLDQLVCDGEVAEAGLDTIKDGISSAKPLLDH